MINYNSNLTLRVIPRNTPHDHNLNIEQKICFTLNLQQFENVHPTVGNQQLEGPRNPENSHLLTYFLASIANKGQ
jgi:hypothetical protein